jgi:2-polyprenyl-6-methoxyphenol hydroxylase-like FAD-dependent oxidoreductase
VPHLLEALRGAEDGYVDAISQIRLDSWSRGRITLVGDAGYAPGPAVGGGTSLAVIGAYVLAGQIAACPDHAVAFAGYERALHEAVHASRDIGPAVIRTLIPRTPVQVAATTYALRLLARLPAALQRGLTSYGGGPAAMLDGVLLPAPAG